MTVPDAASRDFLRMLKFGVVGVSNTAVDFILYVLLTTSFSLWPVVSNIASYTGGVINSFVLNRVWTFSGGEYCDGLVYQLPMFLLASASGLLLSTVIIWLALAWVDPVPAKVVSVLLTLLWNYWFAEKFVFRHKQPMGTSNTHGFSV
jgi:putative flippase GtrA